MQRRILGKWGGVFGKLATITMKSRTTILFLMVFLSIFAQEYPRIDTLYYGNNVVSVLRSFQNIGREEVFLSKYFFNNKGQHITTLTGYNRRKQTKNIFEYDDNGKLLSLKEVEYISPKNDSIEDMLFKELGEFCKQKDFSTESEEWNDYDRRYYSLRENINPEEIDWELDINIQRFIVIKRNIAGLDSIAEVYSNQFEKVLFLDKIVYCFYDNHNRLIRKRWVEIPQNNVFKFQAFNSNSYQLSDSIRVLSNSSRQKQYQYFQDSIKIEYFVNDITTGYEIKRLDKNGGIISEIILSTNKDTLSFFNYVYNSENLLEVRYQIKHVGENGFGFSMDMEWGSIEKYKYDSEDRLIQVDGYEDEKHIYRTIYKIEEKITVVNTQE